MAQLYREVSEVSDIRFMKDRDLEQERRRMAELMLPIEKQILMCDSEEEMLMLACGMLQRTTEIYERLLGERGRKAMFKELA